MNDFLIDLTELNYKKSIDIDLKVNKNEAKDEALDKRIIDLDAYVKGKIYVNSNNDIYLDLDFSGTMYLLDAVRKSSL